MRCTLLPGAALVVLTLFYSVHSAPQPTAAKPRLRFSDSTQLRRPIAVTLVDDGKHLLIANCAAGSISVLDTQGLRVRSEQKFGERLSHLSADASGKTILVCDESAAELIVIDNKDGVLREQHRLKTPITPVSVHFDGRIATVACLWPRQLILIDLGSKQQTAIDLPFAPRCQLAIANTGKLVVADSFGGQLALIDLRKRELESVRTMHVHNIRDLALDSSGAGLLFTHQVLYRQGHPTPGDIQSGNLIANNVRRLSLASVLNPRADLLRDERLYTLGDVERGAGDPTAVAETAEGAMLVTLAGVNELAIGKPEQAIWTRLAVRDRPTALAVDAARSRAYVANTFADSISVIDLQSPRVITEIDLHEDRPRDLSTAERGEKLFFDASLSFEGWYSCHSCHTDGHTNGRLNDNLTDGSLGTPKRVLSLLGVKDTGPWAWNGNMPDLESQVRNSIQSTMQGRRPTTEQVRDITAYLHTLTPPPSLAKARNHVDAAAVERGQRVFEARKCAVCHAGSMFTTPRTYDVGLRDETGETQFNPPSLRGVSQAGPYFHDNRAASIPEVLERFRHRLPEELPAEELRDLLAFLHSL